MSKPTRVLLVVLVVLASLGVWLALTANQVDPEKFASSPTETGTQARSGAHLNVPEPEPTTREGVPSEVEPEEQPRQPSPELEVVPYVTRDLRGTLTLLDEFGNGPFLETGVFAFWIWQGDEPSYHEVQVKRGEWETVLPGDVRISLAEVELGGRVVAFRGEDGPPIEIPVSGYLELEAYIPKATVLHVYALDTRTELDQITVIVERKSQGTLRHPGEIGAENRVAQGVASPIELRAVSGVRIDQEVTYFVKAPGYAWASLRMKHSVGGAHEVMLSPAGSLEVHLSKFDPELFPTFRLWQGRRPVAEIPLTWEREFQLDDLAAGSYLASVDIGRDWRQLERLGEARVKIHAGGTSVVELELGEGPEYERGDLSGILVVPEEWNLASFRLLLRLQSEVASSRESLRLSTNVELANVPGRDDAWRFHFPDLIAGSWQFGVEPTLFAIDVEVTAEDSEDLLIELPPPARWMVRTVDAHTEEPALIEELRYRMVGGYTIESRLAERGDAPNEFWVRGPLGSVLLSAVGAGYREAQRVLELDAPSGEYTLKISGECGIEILPRLAGRAVAWPEDGWASAYEEDEGGYSYEFETREGRQLVYVSQPGVYTIELDEFEEFSVGELPQVLVEAGSFTPCEIELTRKVKAADD